MHNHFGQFENLAFDEAYKGNSFSGFSEDQLFQYIDMRSNCIKNLIIGKPSYYQKSVYEDARFLAGFGKEILRRYPDARAEDILTFRILVR